MTKLRMALYTAFLFGGVLGGPFVVGDALAVPQIATVRIISGPGGDAGGEATPGSIQDVCGESYEIVGNGHDACSVILQEKCPIGSVCRPICGGTMHLVTDPGCEIRKHWNEKKETKRKLHVENTDGFVRIISTDGFVRIISTDGFGRIISTNSQEWRDHEKWLETVAGKPHDYPKPVNTILSGGDGGEVEIAADDSDPKTGAVAGLPYVRSRGGNVNIHPGHGSPDGQVLITGETLLNGSPVVTEAMLEKKQAHIDAMMVTVAFAAAFFGACVISSLTAAWRGFAIQLRARRIRRWREKQARAASGPYRAYPVDHQNGDSDDSGRSRTE